jgi:adenylate cyclase
MEPAGPARVERRLAAILAANVAGYSRLIEADEEGTLGRAQGAARRDHCNLDVLSPRKDRTDPTRPGVAAPRNWRNEPMHPSGCL